MDLASGGDLVSVLITLLVRIVVAMLVLVIGWLISKWLAKLVYKLLHRFDLDERMSKSAGEDDVPAIEEGISKVVYYILMIFVVLAFFEVLGLTIITEPLNALLATIGSYLPQLIGAAAIAVGAWIVAIIARGLTRRLLQGAGVDKRVGDETGTDKDSVSTAVSTAVYWLVWLIFLPAILGALGLNSLVAPLTSMWVQVLAFIPRLIAAAAILVVGYFVARIVQRILVGFLVAIGTDDFSDRIGLGRMLGKQNLSGLLGLLTFIVIMIPVIMAGLEALGLESLTAPLTAMLETVFVAIPAILVATIILIVAYFFGKLLGDIVASLLEGLGFNNIFKALGMSEDPVDGRVTPSLAVGYLVQIAVVYMAALTAANILSLPAVSLVLLGFLQFAWHIIVGLVIFALGVWLAGILVKAIEGTNWPYKRLMTVFTRIVVIALALSMALSQMGLAEPIITLAFGLTLGGIALAAALAFGLGGREVAGRELDDWVTLVHAQPAYETSTADVEAAAEAADDTEAASDAGEGSEADA